MPDQVIRVSNGASLVVRTGTILGVGPRGDIGPQGEIGPQGPPGPQFITGGSAGNPPAILSPPQFRDGDLWVDPAGAGRGDVWQYSAATNTWGKQNPNVNILGPQGIQGNPGPQGQVGPAGPTGSAASGFATYNDLLQTGSKH